ncbi:MAG: type I polyketide synthase, partial [Gammaproteobacteria bacterium]|nr:type I polyketide synthase [Gammaproteobacteria bacterium]
YAEKMADFLENADFNISDIAYTSQVGREAMEERLAVIVSSAEELGDKLRSFAAGEDNTEDLYRGSMKRNKDALAVFEADEDMAKTIDAWIAKEKYSKLLDVWVKGLVFDWNKLYGQVRPKRISLPTYPFAKERYWIEGSDAGDRLPGVSGDVAKLHPLLHRNTSNLSEQRFTSEFTGQEFFLADHMVRGQRVLPGVAYLEMARAAVEYAAEIPPENRTGILLQNVVWARPLTVEDDPVSVHIGLFPEENGELTYEIYSQSDSKSGEEDAEHVVHSQGAAHINQMNTTGEVPALDIESLKAECDQKRFSSDECYETFAKAGLEYGAGHRGIEKIYVGEGRALAKLALPASVSDTADQFILHPGLTDSALQASIVLTAGSGKSEPALPFALERTEILGGCASSMWAFVKYNNRYSEGSLPEDKVRKLDMDLCDENGKVCVRMKGFTSRVQGSEAESTGTLMFRPSWIEEAVNAEADPPDYEKHLIALCEPDEALRKSIEGRIKGAEFIILESEEENSKTPPCAPLKGGINIDKRFGVYALRLFEEIQAVFKTKPKGKALFQVVISAKEDR